MVRVATALLVLVAFPGIAGADAVGYSAGGEIVSISGLTVGSSTYDVNFEWGTFAQVFSATGRTPRFWGSESGADAANASIAALLTSELASNLYAYPTAFAVAPTAGAADSADIPYGPGFAGDSVATEYVVYTPSPLPAYWREDSTKLVSISSEQTVWATFTSTIPTPLALPQGILLLLGVIVAAWWRRRRS